MALHDVFKNKTMIEVEWEKCGEELSYFIPTSKAIRAAVIFDAKIRYFQEKNERKKE